MSLFNRSFACGALVNFLLYVNYYMLIVSIADYSGSMYHVDASAAGLAASVFVLGALAARFVGPLVMRRFGRRRALVVALAADVLLSFAYLMGQNSLGMLIAIRVLHGASYGFAQAAVTAIVTAGIPSDRHGEGIGYYMLSITAGSAVGPFLGMAVAGTFGFTELFVVGTLCSFLALATALPIEDKAARSGGKAPCVKLAEGDEKAKKHGLSDFVESKAVPISLVTALLYLGYGVVVTYLSSFAQQEGLVQEANAFFVVYAAVMFVARPFTGKLFDRGRIKLVMILGFISFAVGLVVLGLAASGLMVYLAAALMGFGVGAEQPSALALALRKSPPRQLEVANSTFFIFIDVAMGLCPVILGWGCQIIGFRGMFMEAAALSLIALMFYLSLSERGKA